MLKSVIITLLACLLLSAARGQAKKPSGNLRTLLSDTTRLNFLSTIGSQPSQHSTYIYAPPFSFTGTQRPAPKRLPPALYVQQLPWSCRQEWKLEKMTSLPLRIRLGSLEMTDKLEGK